APTIPSVVWRFSLPTPYQEIGRSRIFLQRRWPRAALRITSEPILKFSVSASGRKNWRQALRFFFAAFAARLRALSALRCLATIRRRLLSDMVGIGRYS